MARDENFIWKGDRWERGVKDIKKLLIGLLIGRRKHCFGLVRIRGIVYRVDIQQYVSVEEEIRGATNSSIFVAPKS